MGYNLIMIRKEKIEHDIFKLIPELAKVLEKERDVIFAYLFGSYGKGCKGELSDVDVGVLLEGDDLFERKLELISLISAVLKTQEIDLVVLNEASPSLVRSVMDTGKLLFSKDEEKRIKFFSKNLKDYIDFSHHRRKIWDAMKKRIKEGKFGI